MSDDHLLIASLIETDPAVCDVGLRHERHASPLWGMAPVPPQKHYHQVPEWKKGRSHAAEPIVLVNDVLHWKEAIVGYSESKVSLEGARRIDDVRERFEEVCIVAESRLRLLLRKLPSLDHPGPEPEWLRSELSSDELRTADPRALESTRRLVRAALAASGSDATAKCEPASGGGVEVSWEIPMRLTWVVSVPRLPWPGVNLKAYVRASLSSPEMQARSFLLGHRAVEHAAQYLRNP